jgi:outer membrane receptor protein involved in Fe transport
MNSLRKPSISLRRPRRLAALTLLFPIVVSAQSIQSSGSSSDDADEPFHEMQQFVVTGSNIQRIDMEKIAPVTVIDRSAIEVRNALLPVDLLTTLPSVVNLPENETRLGSSGARGDNANINLRNLGATGTLILVNGRRMAVNPMTAGLSQAVNVNQLPTQGIARIEVLRDGASAIYGSDAIGGVINYVLEKRFDGIEVSSRVGVPEHGGGESIGSSVVFGRSFAEGRGRIFGTVEALYREPIRLVDRDFSRTALNSPRAPAPFDALGGAFDDRSPRGLWPTFRIGTATAVNYFRPVGGTPVLTNVAPTRAANPEFFLDLNEYGWAAPRVRRGNAFLSGEYDFGDRLTAFADVAWYKARSTMVRQPLALNAPTSDQLMVMAVDNPYNPYGSAFYHPAGEARGDGAARLIGAPRTISLTALTLPGVAAEQIVTESDVVRLAAGVRGTIGDAWTWESSAFYNRVDGRDDAYPDVRESLLQAALARTDAAAYNPFGYTFRVENGAVVADQPYENPAATVDSFTDTFARSATSEIASVDLRASGRLLSWWAGDVRVAAGTEFRTEELSDVRPPFSGENPASSGLDPLNNDFLLHPPRPDVFGDRDVFSAYAELLVPIVASSRDVPLVDTLELTVSARFEDYSDFGNTTKPKIGLNWRPVSWLMLRGSYNEGFIAPSLAALFTSPRWTITAGAGDIDTYRNPVTAEGPYVQRTYFGGNPDLRPQESEGRTFGVVIDVPGVKGLSFTADYWRIERTDLLGQRSVAQIRESDTALLRAYTREQLAAGVPADQIDVGSGAGYKGDAAISRFDLTAEDRAVFAAYNAANPNNPMAPAGRIFSVDRPFINVASSEDSGVDFGAVYALPRTRIGSVTVNTDWAYVIESRNTVAPANVAPTENDELEVNGVARWRGTTNVSWRNGPWSGGLGVYYVGSWQDSGATTTAAVYESLGRPSYIAEKFTGGRNVYRYVVDSTLTFNASVGYRFANDRAGLLRDTRVRLAVANLTDEEPPLHSDQFGYSAAVHQSLVPGRTWTLEVSKRF